MKICPRCTQSYPLEMFNSNLSRLCAHCFREHRRKYYKPRPKAVVEMEGFSALAQRFYLGPETAKAPLRSP